MKCAFVPKHISVCVPSWLNILVSLCLRGKHICAFVAMIYLSAWKRLEIRQCWQRLRLWRCRLESTRVVFSANCQSSTWNGLPEKDFLRERWACSCQQCTRSNWMAWNISWIPSGKNSALSPSYDREGRIQQSASARVYFCPFRVFLSNCPIFFRIG